MKTIKPLLLACLFIFFTGIRAQTTLKVAEDFSIKTIEGAPLVLFDILDAGNYVVIDFFSTSCGPCHEFAPDIQAAYERYGENQSGVYFLGISYGGNNAQVLEFAQDYNLEFPVVSGNEGGGYQVHIDYGIQSVPTMALIAPDREIVSQLFMPAYPPSTVNIDSVLSQAGIFPVSACDPYACGPDQQEDLIVFPNPVSDNASFSFRLEKPAREVLLDVVDLSGKVVDRKSFGGYGQGTHEFNYDVSDLNGKTYFMLMRADQQVFRKKIIVE